MQRPVSTLFPVQRPIPIRPSGSASGWPSAVVAAEHRFRRALLGHQLLVMAITIFRSPRRTEFLDVSVSTSENVAPGSYTLPSDFAKVVKESPVPFDSLQEKWLNQNQTTSRITPGPGTYLGSEVLELVMPSPRVSTSLGASTLRSSVKRFAPTAPGSTVFTTSTIAKNPGPGTYTMESRPDTRSKKPIQPMKPVLEAQDKTIPSIPLTRLLPGQEPDTEAGKAEISTLMVRHTGEKGDTVGPGEYEPEAVKLPYSATPQVLFRPSTKSGRNIFSAGGADPAGLPASEGPGPGTYNVSKEISKVSMDDEPTNTSQFASKTALAHQMKPKYTFPGPGQYDLKGTLESQLRDINERKMILGDRVRFGSVTERVGWWRPVDQPYKDPYNVRYVPGPGYYHLTQSDFSTDPKKSQAEKALPDNAKKKIHGVHHPALISTLRDVEGPMHAFLSTDDRPCNKAVESKTPSPGEYTPETARGVSLVSTLKEKAKVGRKGVFGSCADRFHGSPLAGSLGSAELSGDFNDSAQMSGTAETRAVFQSQTPRFQITLPASSEVSIIRVGNLETPSPGQYEVCKEPIYKSPFRVPKSDHLSFGSGKGRFEAGQDAVFVQEQRRASSIPGPGSYKQFARRRIPGAPNLQDKRRPPHVGCTAAEVGPGSYGSSIETSMLKRTFNVTTGTFLPSREPTTPRASASVSMMTI